MEFELIFLFQFRHIINEYYLCAADEFAWLQQRYMQDSFRVDIIKREGEQTHIQVGNKTYRYCVSLLVTGQITEERDREGNRGRPGATSDRRENSASSFGVVNHDCVQITDHSVIASGHAKRMENAATRCEAGGRENEGGCVHYRLTLPHPFSFSHRLVSFTQKQTT